jgi:hypothetical protein
MFVFSEIFSISDPNQKSSEDAFHFLAFVPHGGRLYELDGLNTAPVDHGAVGDSDWYVDSLHPLLYSMSDHVPRAVQPYVF